ncbi:hypothetical protein F7734_04975 [Scytonema sp. UIC 10036]|uniref:hypothetical protein n=1 Tax=Scytonema sp. UIC 10036 TaxID=2304196 RepID=UPI0012DA8BB3|nr:hypothetical protein [Scytonema sp. UIC 10036]MUG91859.1 hypothetical protein [Scytonema sp. UIC 10036]
MFARIRKTVVTAIVAVIATASTGFGMIFLAAFITVLSGNASTKTAQETPVMETQAQNSPPLPAVSQ